LSLLLKGPSSRAYETPICVHRCPPISILYGRRLSGRQLTLI